MKIIFKVKDMHCAGCVMKLESIEDEIVGVKRITASLYKQQMEVEFDDAQIGLDKIIQAAKKKGYEINPI